MRWMQVVVTMDAKIRGTSRVPSSETGMALHPSSNCQAICPLTFGGTLGGAHHGAASRRCRGGVAAKDKKRTELIEKRSFCVVIRQR